MKTYSTIEEWMSAGYEFRIPGGKSRGDTSEETHASFCVIPRRKVFYTGREVVEILVIPCLRKDLQQQYIKKEKKFSEKPQGTLEREVGEETGITLQEYDPLGEIPFSDSANIHDKHVQYAYISTLYDDSNVRKEYSPSQPNLGIPVWIPLSRLETILFPRHRWMLKMAKEYLGFFSKKIPIVHSKPLLIK